MSRPNGHPSLREKGPIGYRTKGADGPVLTRVHTAVSDWRWGLSIGLIAVVGGAVALIDADATLGALAAVIGASQTIQGLLSVIAAWRTPSSRKDRVRHTVLGLLLTGAGASSLGSESAGTRALVIATGIWFAVVAVQDLTDATRTATGRWWKVSQPVVSLLAAAAVLTHPDLRLTAIARYVGIAMVCRGALLIANAWTRSAAGPARQDSPPS